MKNLFFIIASNPLFSYTKRLAIICVLLSISHVALANSKYYSKATADFYSNTTGSGKVYVGTSENNNIADSDWKTTSTSAIGVNGAESSSDTTYYYYANSNAGSYFVGWYDAKTSGNLKGSKIPYTESHTTSTSSDAGITRYANFRSIIEFKNGNEVILYQTSDGKMSSKPVEINVNKSTKLTFSNPKSSVFAITAKCETTTSSSGELALNSREDVVTLTVGKVTDGNIKAEYGEKKYSILLTPANTNISDTREYNPNPETLWITIRTCPEIQLLPAENGSYTYQQKNIGGTVTSVQNDGTKLGLLPDNNGEDGVLSLVATANSNYRFSKWIITRTIDGTITTEYDYNASTSVKIESNATIKPIFVHNKYARFAVKGVNELLYDDMQEGLNEASNSASKVLMVETSGHLASGDYTIPQGVTLLVPGDDANTVSTGDVGESDFAANATSTCKKYLTMEDNTNIVVESKGAISVYAKMTYQQPYNGKPLTYGRLDMGNNCHITVRSEAVLSALGYITGDHNTSSVTIESGATVYESFQIRDWRGGTTTLEVAGLSTTDILKLLATDVKVKGTDEKVFPVGQYYMQNVETKLILEAGAIEKLTTAANMSLSSYNIVMVANAPFVVPDNDSYSSGLFRLGTETQFEKYYDREKDRQVLTVKGLNSGGEANFGVMSLVFPVTTLGTHNLTVTSEYYVLPLTNNLDITLDNIDITTKYDMALLGDASITIKEGASLILDGGARFFVSDKEESKHMWYGAAAGNATINPVYYTPANSQYLLNASGGKISSTSDAVVKDANMYKTGSGNLYKRQVDDITTQEGDIAMRDGRIVVNGKLDVKNGYLYTTASGADITSDGGGKVIFGKVDHSTKDKYYRYLQALQGDLAIGFHAIPVTNAKLHNNESKNPNEHYSAGLNAQANHTYTYVNSLGKWMLPQSLQITKVSGNTFNLTLPEDVVGMVKCIIQADKTISVADFNVTYPSNGRFTKPDGQDVTFADDTLFIPVKYAHKNEHNVECKETLTIEYVNFVNGSAMNQKEEIQLTAKEDYTLDYTVSSISISFASTNVNAMSSQSLTISKGENNVANLDRTVWESEITGYNKDDFMFDITSGLVTFKPTSKGSKSATLTITATYTDAQGIKLSHVETVQLTGEAKLNENTLKFANFPQPITLETSAFELLKEKNSDGTLNVTVSDENIASITGSGTLDEPYMVKPNALGVVTIIATQLETGTHEGITITTTIAVIPTEVSSVPFCLDDLTTFNKYLYGAKSVSYNATNEEVEFNSTASSSEWIFRFSGTPDKLNFTPTGNNTWNIQERSADGKDWSNIVSWASLTGAQSISLEPTTRQVRVQYGTANVEVGKLSGVCVTELQIAADVEKVYMPIYADRRSEKNVVLTHTLSDCPTIALTGGLEYSILTKALESGLYQTKVTIIKEANASPGTYTLTATENNHTVRVEINTYKFPQELPIKLASDLPANGDRYYYVTTASSYASWDATNRQVIFQNPGAQLTRSVTFAFNGAPSIIRFDVSSADGEEVIFDTDWIIEESADGEIYNQSSLDNRDSVATNTLTQCLNYTTRYVRVKYNSIHTKEIRLSNLVIEGYPNIIVTPQNMMFGTSTDQQYLAAIAINLQQVDFEIDNTSAFQITMDTTFATGWGDKVEARESTHPTALGINKVDTIFLGVKWLKTTALDEGTITIKNKENDSILTVIPLLGSDSYLIKDNARNTGIYTGIDSTKYTYHNGIYRDYDYHLVDLTNAFAEDGTAMFDYLFIYGETTPASGDNITSPKKWTGDDKTSEGSNAQTPLFVYKKALNADNEYKGYQFVTKVENVNVGNKPMIAEVLEMDSTGVIYFDAQDITKNMKVYMTGFAPYATTGYDKLQEGVFLFRGKHGSKLDIYLEDFHVFSRNKTITGHAFDGKDGGEDYSDGYARGSGGVFVFENVDPQEQLQNYQPFEVSIHTMGDNLLKSNYGCFFALKIANTTAMKATQVSSPIQVHMHKSGYERKTKATLNFDDIWPTALNANNEITDSIRTNGYLGLKKQANNAPSIDLGNKHTVVNFKGGQVELQNSQIGSDTYKTTLAISHRSGYFGSDDAGVQLCYGIGTDSVGGTVNFLDGTITVEPMYVKPAYRQYYLMDTLPNGDDSEYTTCLRTPKNTYIKGGSVCRVRACQHVTSKGGAPKDREYGSFLGQYVYTLQGSDALDNATKLAHIVEFPSCIEGLELYHQNNAYVYGLNSVTPDEDNQYYFWIPNGMGGVEAEVDKYMSTWKACMTEIGAGIPNVAEGRVGGDTPIEVDEEVKYFMYCKIDDNIRSVISAGEEVGGVKDYTYLPPFEVPRAALEFFENKPYVRYDLLNYVSDSLQYQVTSDTAYTITDKVYYVATATADVWQTFTAPFNVANIYVVEAYSENVLSNFGTTRTDKLEEQARHNADFAAFFAVAMAMGTYKDFDGIYNSYINWARNEDDSLGLSWENGNLRGMYELTPYVVDTIDNKAVGNWETANFYLNHNDGFWILNDDEDFGFETKWRTLSSADTTDGILLHKGETYSMLFPYCVGCGESLNDRNYWDYWSGKFLIFESTGGPHVINGRDFLNDTIDGNIFSESMNGNNVKVTGNSTFAFLETEAENVYVYNSYAPMLGAESFVVNEEQSIIYPTTAFLYGYVPTPEGASVMSISRMGKINYRTGDSNGDDTPTGGEHVPTVGGGSDIFVTSVAEGINIAVSEPQYVGVFSANGALLYNGWVETAVNVNLVSNGVYVVVGENNSVKVVY